MQLSMPQMNANAFFGMLPQNAGVNMENLSSSTNALPNAEFQQILSQFTQTDLEVLSEEEIAAIAAVMQGQVPQSESIEGLENPKSDLSAIPFDLKSLIQQVLALKDKVVEANSVDTQIIDVKTADAQILNALTVDALNVELSPQIEGKAIPLAEKAPLTFQELTGKDLQKAIELLQGLVDQINALQPNVLNSQLVQKIPEPTVNLSKAPDLKGNLDKTPSLSSEDALSSVLAPMIAQLQELITAIQESPFAINQQAFDFSNPIVTEANLVEQNAESTLDYSQETLQTLQDSIAQVMDSAKQFLGRLVQIKNPESNVKMPVLSEGVELKTTLQAPVDFQAFKGDSQNLDLNFKAKNGEPILPTFAEDISEEESKEIDSFVAKFLPVSEESEAKDTHKSDKNASHNVVNATESTRFSESLQSNFTTQNSLKTANISLQEMRTMAEGTRMNELMEKHQAVNQIAHRVQFMMRNGEGHAVLRLDPPELGHIELEVETKSGEMKIHMTVENEHVKNTLESSISQLRSSMEQQNIKLEKMEIQVDSSRYDAQGGLAEQRSNQAERNRKMAQNRRGMRIADIQINTPVLEPGKRLGYNTMEMIA